MSVKKFYTISLYLSLHVSLCGTPESGLTCIHLTMLDSFFQGQASMSANLMFLSEAGPTRGEHQAMAFHSTIGQGFAGDK
jgi:hypothetical protein